MASNRATAFMGALLFSTVNFVTVQATSIKMDYLPIGSVRTDPILSKDCLSDHVHTFYGPQRVHPKNATLADLMATEVSENTGNVEENKSLYWHPTVYSYDKSTDTYTRDKIAQSSAYYIWEFGAGVQAFPNGFSMIGGHFPEQSMASALCVNPQPCEKDDCSTENSFFPSTACDELEVSMRFPSCWDGVHLSSIDGTTHVAYPSESDFDGTCPQTHPVQLPQIHLFFRIMPYDGGWHTFSDGSDVYHADYVSGWDEDFLQNVIDNCENEGAAAMPNFFCEDMLTFRDAPKCTDESTCDFADPALIEKLQNIQPQPLDVLSTVSSEETKTVVGALPRGTCTGDLFPDFSLAYLPFPTYDNNYEDNTSSGSLIQQVLALLTGILSCSCLLSIL